MDKNKTSLLPQRLKELRLHHGLTQTQLGEKVGIKQNTFTNWENGKRTPSIEDIIKLSNIFNVSIDYLLGLSNEKSHYIDPSEENKRIRTEVALLEITDLLLNINKEAEYTGQTFEEIISSLSLSEQTKKLYNEFLNFARYEYFGDSLGTNQP
ncbi:helix-turn-helix domain-containing protein [Streptococcus suis]|uniref:helix-turn-helix domain-containing protein n=1 Tax=Streptococcus suis TaxID=1307 RepID=UPI001ABDEB72|nr:helix-turn-helix transcriptional regulator [Streptococcus suis]